MVPDHLTRLWSRWRAGWGAEGHDPWRWLPVVGSGVAIGLMGALWLSAEDPKTGVEQRRPSLLDLLEEVQEQGRPEKAQPDQPPPKLPRAVAWSSPLAQQCSGIDPKLRQRLLQERRQLPGRRQRIAIDPTNFGDRYRRDPWGRNLNPSPRVVVLHETVYSLQSALNTFRTPHPRDEDQVSYHTLIGLDGTVVDVVDPLKRAFGAGYSAFLGEWAATNPNFQGSVNNFALHLSLETPEDGQHNNPSHSGYTEAQYDALALVLHDWIRSFGIPPAAITTHEHVDLGGERADPRSFDWSALQQRLAGLGDLCAG
jgi:N-acetylmuramoyl-L-alanine amidase